MLKKSLSLGMVLFLSCCAAFAQEESFTITTYYPSPYGSYNELKVGRSVTYMPVNNYASLPNPREGELVYNGPDRKFYYWDGSGWKVLGGGSTNCDRRILESLSCWGD